MKKINIFLLFLLLESSSCFCQDIYILGTVRKADILKIKFLISDIYDNYSPKKIQLFDHSSKFYTYKRYHDDDNILSDRGLDSVLNYLMLLHSSLSTNAPSISEISQEKDKISTRNSGKGLIIYDKTDRQDPPSTYNDFSSLRDWLSNIDNKDKKFVILLVLTKDKPIVNINFPESNQTISSKIIEGTASGIDSVSSVLIKLNNGKWQKANGLSSWSLELPFTNEISTIEAIAIDNYGDTSFVNKVSDIQYKEKMPPSIDFIYPNESRNVVPKCMKAQVYSYHFKISADSAIDVDKLIIIIEDFSGVTRGIARISKLADEDKIKMPFLNEHCFFTTYGITGSPTPCSIDADEDYFYRIEYNGSEKVIVPQRIKVHFTSFSTEADQLEPCNCE